MFVKNNGLLFNKSSIDKNGKSTIQDPTTGRPIYIGPGLIPQIEAYADKYAYNKMTVDVLNTIVTTMAQKANSPKGNKWVFIMNEKLMLILLQLQENTYRASIQTEHSYIL